MTPLQKGQERIDRVYSSNFLSITYGHVYSKPLECNAIAVDLRKNAAVSHECDFPPEARSKPVLIVSRISHTESAAAIDRQVREFLERGESLYSVDLTALASIEPDLIVTQDLCHVCAATPDDLGAALAHLRRRPQIVTLNPHSLADVCADIRAVARATGRSERANTII